MNMNTPVGLKGTVVVLDNQDSFTYNLVDELAQLGLQVEVYRNTVALAVITQRLAELTASATGEQATPVTVVLSPGPGYPSQAGNLMALINHCAGRYPMLGICLGFQAIIEHFGGTIGPCSKAAHGKAATISTTNHPLFGPLSNNRIAPANGELTVARYHSLQATQVPSELHTIAHYQGIPMAVCHHQLPIAGLQFHPESIMTIRGSDILRSCLAFLTQMSNVVSKENKHA